jgi:hypothetical protein
VKPFCMAMALMFFQQFSGINAVIFNLQGIFMAAGNEIPPSGMSAFVVCLVQVVFHNHQKINMQTRLR